MLLAEEIGLGSHHLEDFQAQDCAVGDRRATLSLQKSATHSCLYVALVNAILDLLDDSAAAYMQQVVDVDILFRTRYDEKGVLLQLSERVMRVHG